ARFVLARAVRNNTRRTSSPHSSQRCAKARPRPAAHCLLALRRLRSDQHSALKFASECLPATLAAPAGDSYMSVLCSACRLRNQQGGSPACGKRLCTHVSCTGGSKINSLFPSLCSTVV